MKDDKRAGGAEAAASASIPNRILGSLRDALNAAGREERSGEITVGQRTEILPKTTAAEAAPTPAAKPGAAATRAPEIATVSIAQPVSAADAVREAKAPTRTHFEASEPTAPAARTPAKPGKAAVDPEATKTLIVRGRPKLVNATLHQDPVVGWLVVVAGHGLGAFRPLFEGNNTVGRGQNQRVPIDFGDDAISSEEQAYIRYDSMDRSFLFVPNLSKTNIVAINDRKPTAAVKLELMDVITMGRTKLAFVPFCGEDFDWSELADLKE
jgi:hypothetical protein